MVSLRMAFPWTFTAAAAWALTLGAVPAAADPVLADFEPDVPTGWFVFSGGGATVTTAVQTVGDADPMARPGQVGPNNVLETVFNVGGGFAGFGQDLSALGGPQDWSAYEGLTLWFYGSNSGQAYQAEIFDNRSDPSTDTAERFDVNFVDDFTGWRRLVIPFTEFTRATDFQPPGAPNDGLGLTEMWGWSIVLLGGTSGTFYADDIGLAGPVVDDFESGLPSGTDANGNPIGFYTFNDPSSSVAVSTSPSPPDPVPGAAPGNIVLKVDTAVVTGGYGGIVHAFENPAVDTWTPQDWSRYEGIRFWLYGNGTGRILFLDILDNRAPGSTTDTAERFSIDIPDDFSGWRLFETPFADLHRKEIGNGAPNDGLGLTEVHGWAFGVFDTGLPLTNYLDDVGLFGEAPVPELNVTFSAASYDVTEGGTVAIAVKLSRALGETEDPVEVAVSLATEDGSATAGQDYVPVSTTLMFVAGGPEEQTVDVITFGNDKHDGTRTVILRLFDPVDAPLGPIFQSRINVLDDDPLDPSLVDDFEDFPYLWSSTPNVTLSQVTIPADDPMALPGQVGLESVLSARVPLRVDIDVKAGLCNQGNGVIPVVLLTTTNFDATTVDHTTVTFGDAHEAHVSRKTGLPQRHETDADHDGDIDLVFHFRLRDTGLNPRRRDCDPRSLSLNGVTFDGQPITTGGADARFGRDFPLGRDWSLSSGLRFWYYGQNTGETIFVELLDNRAPDPGPDGWSLVWSDEFDDATGTSPSPARWRPEIGDGTVNGIPGWGNSELQYYTASTDNAATDGLGHLVIRAAEADGSLTCYYGPCRFTSARLISQERAEFAYGRIEARIKVAGGVGLWPAFWSLGTDIGEVGWPQAGEIDFMEFVGRAPLEIFGTIHGPGYSGGASFGGRYFFSEPVSDYFHTFAVEWQPDAIRWLVDGIEYHRASPADVAPNEWVFNKPLFLLMNLAVGGNFGGAVDPGTTFPQTTLVDYVRVYQGPDTAERFESSFVDDFSGWKEVVVPFDSFVRSPRQPDGAPDDGLGLTEVWGYGFRLPDGSSTSTVFIAGVRVEQPTLVVVTNTNDSGPGSLRLAIRAVATGGTVVFDPGLAGGTLTLTSGPLSISGKAVNVDASAAPDLRVSGGGADRVLIVDAGASANLGHLLLADGFGWQLAGCVLNNGTLTLDHVTVAGCTMATDAGDFWQGGGGIYNGGGATLNLIDSTVANNTAGWSGGGVFSFFNTTTRIVRSTISGNTSNDVGGGLRSLGDAEIVNSTISGNTATGWYGGALFITDGVVDISNTTIANNVGPDWAPFAVFVGTFTDASATLNLRNSIVANNQWAGCFLGYFGSGGVALNSGGHNVASDDTCNLTAAGDQPNTDPLLGPLADNGGPTETQALDEGSPAIDAADAAGCPATDQRGVSRPQGPGCDVGAYERVP